MKKENNNIKKYILPILSTILVMFYPCYFMYCTNADEIGFSEILLISGIFILFGLLMLLIFKFVFKDINKSTLFVNVTMLILLNYTFVYNFLNRIIVYLNYTQIMLIIFCVVILFGVYISTQKNSFFILKSSLILCIVFGSLILLNFFISIPIIIEKSNININLFNNYLSTNDSKEKSNVYYFIFDEMAGQECLTRYCNYDNSEFYNQLNSLGFNISYTSHGETTSTNIVLANLFNFDKVVDYNDLKAKRKKYIENPLLYKIIKDNNYDINIVDSIDYLGTKSARYKYEVIKSKINLNDTATYYILKNTILSEFLFDNNFFSMSRVEIFKDELQYCEKSFEIKPKNLFTMFYSTMAHGPWNVDENGSIVYKGFEYDWKDSNKYIMQLKFTQKELLKTIESIIKKDPNSVILIQGDHGYRQPFHLHRDYNIKMEDAELENYYMTNIFNCIYYKGEIVDIEGMSNTNTLRLLLNKLWNTNIQYEELKQYVRPYNDYQF